MRLHARTQQEFLVMSSLAFDKQGKPFSFQRRTKKLLVRLFRNPSARGTCCQVMNAEGQPLYVDPETDYMEFRKAVGHVPGLYRLDQCDENGVELDDAQPAYVAIDTARNASASGAEGCGAGDVNPLVIIEHLVAIQADAMKTMAAQHAAVMAATAEILRAPYRPAPPAPAPAPRNAQPEDDSDEDEDVEETPVVVESPWAPLIEKALPMFQMIGSIGMVLLQQKFLPGTAVAMPGMGTPGMAMAAGMTMQGTAMPGMHMPGAAMPGVQMAGMNPGTVAAAAQAAHVPVNVAAAPVHIKTPASVVTASANVPTVTSSTAATASPAVTVTALDEAIETDADGTIPNAIDDDTIDGSARVTADHVDASVASAEPGVACLSTPVAAPMPLPQQYAHLLEIRARLLPDERAFAEAVIAHMTPERRAQWIAALSAMSIDDATASIRSTIVQLRAGNQ